MVCDATLQLLAIFKQIIVQGHSNSCQPREISSKNPNAHKIHNSVTKKSSRDPRFDHLCGSFNEKAFKNAYSFVNDIRSNEKIQLKNELKKEKNPVKKEKIKYLIQRMENQDREEQRQQLKEQKRSLKHQEEIDLLNQGIKPWHRNKADERTLELVNQFEELKKKGRLRKFIEKQRRKGLNKDRKKFPAIDADSS